MSLTSEASVTSTAEEVPAGPPSTVKVQPSRATAGFSGRLGRLAEGWAFLCVLEATHPLGSPMAAHGVAYEVRRHTLRVEPDAQPDPHRRNGRARAPVSSVAGRAAHGLDAGASAPPRPLCRPVRTGAQMASPQCAPGNPRPHAPIPQGPGPVRQVPLLYWAERRQWMWHKKWTLPKLHVRVTCDGRLVGG